jgi:hypothetical protein
MLQARGDLASLERGRVPARQPGAMTGCAAAVIAPGHSGSPP